MNGEGRGGENVGRVGEERREMEMGGGGREERREEAWWREIWQIKR